jgi:hypothetical protein
MKMAKQPAARSEEETELTDQGPKRLARTICLNIMAALGRPGDFLRIAAYHVSGNSYRVNVLTGADAASARIAHSFFVTADASGSVTGSDPVIVKQY